MIQGMAEGVANIATLPTHLMAKLRHGIVRQGIAEGVASLTTVSTDGRTGARYSEAMYS